MSRNQKILILVGAILNAVILILIIRHYQLRIATETYIAKLKARGEPMKLAQVTPPPAPPDQNGAPLISSALAHLKSGMATTTNNLFTLQMVAPGKAIVNWQQSTIQSVTDTNKWTWDQLGGELTGIQKDLNRFQVLMDHPVLDFNLDYSQGWSMPVPHLGQLRRAAQWLSAATFYDLHQGNPSGACTHAQTILAIIKGETEERTTLSQVVRVALASISAGDTWEILQYPSVSDDALAQLQQDWDSLRFVAPSERALLWERVAAIMAFDQIRESDFRKTLLPARGKWIETEWDWFWSYEDELRGLKTFQVVINAARMAETNGSFQPVSLFVHTNFVRLGLEKENGENQFTNSDMSPTEEMVLYHFEFQFRPQVRFSRHCSPRPSWQPLLQDSKRGRSCQLPLLG